MSAGYLRLTPVSGGLDFNPSGSFSAVLLLENYDDRVETRYLMINGDPGNAGWALFQYQNFIHARVWDAGGASYTASLNTAFVQNPTGYRVKVLVAIVYDQPSGDLYVKHIRTQYASEAVQSNVNNTAPASLRVGTVGFSLGSSYSNAGNDEFSGGIFWGAVYDGYLITDQDMLDLWDGTKHPKDDFPYLMYIQFDRTPADTYTTEGGNYTFDVINKEFFPPERPNAAEDTHLEFNLETSVNQAVKEPSNSQLLTPAGSFTVAVYVRWVRDVVGGSGTLIGRMNGSGNYCYSLASLHKPASNIHRRFILSVSKDGSGTSGVSTPDDYAVDGRFYLVVGTYEFVGDGTSILKLYVNEDVWSITDAEGPLYTGSNAELWQGRNQVFGGENRTFGGTIYWTALWDGTVLTPADIANLRTKTKMPWQVEQNSLRYLNIMRVPSGSSYTSCSDIGGVPLVANGVPVLRGVGGNTLPLFRGHATLKNDLAALYPFDLHVGGDVIGERYGAIGAGAPIIIEDGGKFRGAVEFDGNDSIDLHTTGVDFVSQASWAVSMWVRHAAGAWGADEGLMWNAWDTRNLSVTGAKPQITADIGLTHTDSLSVDQWHHLIFMCEDGVGSTIVIDGDWAGRATTANTGAFRGYFAGRDTTNFFTGRMCQLCFHDRILTQQESEDMWNGGAGLGYLPPES